MLNRKQTSGSCPYCFGTSFSEGSERRPRQRVDKCNACDKYSVLNLNNGTRYPLTKPDDESSSPHM